MSDATPQKPRKWTKRLALFCVAVAALFGILIGGLQSGAGKAYLLRVGGEQLESLVGIRLSAEGPAGFWPFDIQVARLTLSDDEGVFFHIEGLELHLSGTALLGGKVKLSQVGADHIAFDRIPALPPSESPETETSGVPSFDAWPSVPEWLQLDAVEIDRLHIAEAVAGRTLNLSVSGSLNAPETPPIQLSIRAPEDDATATLSGALGPEALDLHLDIEDRGLLSALQGETLDVDATLQATGPVENLALLLDAQVNDAPLVHLDGTANLQEALSAALDATVNLDNSALSAYVPVAYRETLRIKASQFSFRDNVVVADALSLSMRPEAPVAELAASLRYPLETGAIMLDVSGEAPDINHFAPGLSDTPLPLVLRLEGTGPREQLAATLNVTLDGKEAATGQASINASDTLGLSGQFVLRSLTPVLGEAADGLFEDGLKLDVAVVQETADRYRVDTFALEAASNTVSATGHISTALDDIDIAATLAAQRLADFAPILPVPLSGAVEGAFRVTADAARMEANGNLAISELVISDYAIARGALELQAEGGPLPNQVLEGLTARIDGRLEEVAAPQYTSPQITLALEAQPADDGDIVLSGLTLSDGITELSGEGRFATDFANFSLVGQLLADDLRPYVAESPVPLAARLRAELSAGRTSSGPITYSLNLGANAREDGTEELRVLLAEEATLVVSGNYHENRVVLDALSLASSVLNLDGAASYGMEEGTVNGSATGRAPDLGAFAAFLDTPLDGAADFVAEFSGKLDEGLAAELTLQGENLVYDTYRADTLTATVDASGLPDGASGQVTLEAALEGEDLESRIAFAQLDRTLNFEAITLSLAENELRGEASVHLDTLAVESRLAVAMPRLEAFAGLLGQPVAGALSGELRLARAGESVAIVGQLEGKDIVFAPADLQVNTMSLNSDLSGALPALEGTLDLDVAELILADNLLQAGRIELVGDGAQMRYRANLSGRAAQDYPFGLEGAGTFSADLSEIRLDRLEGDASVFPLNLESPLVVQADSGGYRATPFSITVGSGTIEGGGAISEEVVNGELAWRGFVLNELDELGLPSFQGASSGTILLSGTLANPTLKLDATVSDFYPGEVEDGEEVKTLQVALQAVLTEDNASGDLQVDGEPGFTAEATVATPLQFSLAPFTVNAGEDAPLNGRIVATGDMADLIAALALRDHLVEGTLDAEFDLSGTVSTPLMTGEAHWREGRYENSETSTIYENIRLTLDAEGRRIRLTEFEGTDPTGGTLQADGQIDLDPETGFPFRFEARAGKTRMVHRDDLTAVADGVLTVAGTMERIEVTGDLTAGPATIVIPERLPPSSLKVIEYEEVNREAADLPPQEPKEAQEGATAGPEIVLNIKVNMPNQVYVRAAALDSEWQGNLEIAGTAADPRIGGILRVVRGNVDFLGRRFDLRTSTISFDKAVPPSPFVDVTAATQTREVTARVRARGEFDNLEITMESDPALPQDEVLAQVLFNRQLSEVSPLQAVQLAQAAAALRSGASGSRLLGGGSTVPGIDRLDFRQGATPGETAIGVGKNLGENVYVEVQQSVGAESSKVLVQVEVTPNFSIEAEAGASATSGAGAFYKKDY